jgi:hypothetical protein
MVWKILSLPVRRWAALALLAAAVLLLSATPQLANAQEQSAPSITLSPATAQSNQAIALLGQNFTAGGGASLASVTVGGALVPPSKLNFGAPVTVDHGGKFVANLIIPLNAASLEGGTVTVSAQDSAGKSATATLTIPQPSLSVSPAVSRLSSTVTVSGSNFPRDNSSMGADDVAGVVLEYEVAANQFRRVATASLDHSGSFTATFTVPANAPAPSSENQVRATISGVAGQVSAKHSVLSSSFTLSPPSGTAGASISLHGADFMPFTPVQSLLLGNVAVEIPGGLYTDAAGRFNTTFQVPEADGGPQAMLLTVGERVYSQVFTVEGVPPAPAIEEPGPTRLTFEVASAMRPLEGNLLRVFYFDNATKEWSFYDPRPEVARFNTLREMVEGEPYWVGVRRDQHPAIQGRLRSFVEGWNLLVW